MRVRGILLLGLSLVFGFLAFALIRGQANLAAGQTTQVVVAKSTLNFGERITGANLQLADYPAKLVPAGAFSTIDGVAAAGEDRLALRTVVAGEIILPSNVSAKGARSVLSTLIDQGKRAITVPVNDVKGVAGFVRVSDRVDVLLTRNDHSQTDVLLQDVRVLAVDQHAADDGKDKIAVAKAVTLEVSPQDAQKLALGGTIGTLSLALRGAEAAGSSVLRPILVGDLAPSTPEPAKPAAAPAHATPSIQIVRGTDATSYAVAHDGLVEGGAGSGAIASGGRAALQLPKPHRPQH